MIIAIDHGNSSIKTENEEFPAGLANSLGMGNVESVEYKGQSYEISGKRPPFKRDKTTDDDYFILSLFAFGKETDELESEVELAIGLPPEYIKTEREKFEKYFLDRSPINFKYNGTPLRIDIKRVWCFPQAYAAAMTKRDALKDKQRVFIIDVGGMTVDTLLLQNLKPDMGFTNSLRGGINLMCNDIEREVSANLGMQVNQGQIEDWLRGKDDFLQAEVGEVIEKNAAQFVNRMIDDLRERDIDLQTAQGVFVGGGSLLLREWIGEHRLVRSPIFIEDVRANAKGYKLFAEGIKKREGN